MDLSPQEKNLVTNSYAAFQASHPSADDRRTAALLNGDTVSDSESDDAIEYISLKSLTDDRAKKLVSKRRRAISRRTRRQKAKAIAEKNFLGRKRSRSVHSVENKYPNIGKEIEGFVSSCNIGADAWRRTSVLTFDGNIRVNKKVTYSRIQEHLKEKYGCKLSYGTVVQLCIARNKRKRSAANYKGVAKVTTRRARKGFEIKFNLDRHWSNTLYRGLDFIQYTDGSNIININRDDASGFRLDTLATHCKHATPAVAGEDLLTTHTDYVNRPPSILQTTPYNISGTKTTKEMCAGIVTGSKVFPRNPAQHYADLKMLTEQPQFSPVFNSDCGCPKQIECVRVDGATYEGPSHDEVKYWWAVRHVESRRLVTLVSCRSSGSSFLNRAELQNGCLALGHTTLFIPSTLGGSPYNPDTGFMDMERVVGSGHQCLYRTCKQ